MEGIWFDLVGPLPASWSEGPLSDYLRVRDGRTELAVEEPESSTTLSNVTDLFMRQARIDLLHLR